MNLHQQIHARLLDFLNRTPSSEASLNNALRLLAKYRSTLIQNTLVQQCCAKVIDGPFAGMEYIEQSAEGCHVPKLPLFLQQLGHLDQLLAQWEWRSAPTPWAILHAKD